MSVTLPPAHLTGCFLGKPEVLARSCTDIPLVQDCGVIQGLHDKAYDRALEELRETAVEMNLIELAYGEAETRDLRSAPPVGIRHGPVRAQRGRTARRRVLLPLEARVPVL